MRFKFIRVILPFFLLFSFNGYGSVIDSLKQCLIKAKHDTTRCALINDIAEEESDWNLKREYFSQMIRIARSNLKSKNKLLLTKFKGYIALGQNGIGFTYCVEGDNKKGMQYFDSAFVLSTKINNRFVLTKVYSNYGSVYYNNGDIDAAIKNFEKSLALRKNQNDPEGISRLLNNLGIIYNEQGNIQKSMEYHEKSLKIREQSKDYEGMISSYNNIGYLYRGNGDNDLALQYYEKGLALTRKLKNTEGEASILNNIAAIYYDTNKKDKAIEYYKKSLILCLTSNRQSAIAICYHNIGCGFMDKGQYDSASFYIQKAIEIRTAIQHKSGLSISYIKYGNLLLKQNKLAEAEKYSLKAYQLSKELGYIDDISAAAENLKHVYEKKGDFKKSLEMFEEFITMRDSFTNTKNEKLLIQNHFRHEYEKKYAADSVVNIKTSELKNATIAKHKAEIRSKKNMQIGLISGLCILAVFAYFIYNRFRLASKQKKTIIEQKHLVEEKQKEILDSIRYAQRIQRSILTSEKYIEKEIKRMKG